MSMWVKRRPFDPVGRTGNQESPRFVGHGVDPRHAQARLTVHDAVEPQPHRRDRALRNGTGLELVVFVGQRKVLIRVDADSSSQP